MKLTFTLLFIAFIANSYSQRSSIDQSFGNNGFVITAADSRGLFDVAAAAALQPDGKILVSGISSDRFIPQLIRYMPNGSIDYTFGKNGNAAIDSFKVIIANNFTPVIKPNGAAIAAIAIQPDGKIVVARNKMPFTQVFAYRFMPDGRIDSGYGNNGVFTNPDFSFLDNVNAIKLQPDGKLLIAGSKSAEYSIYDGGVLMRLNADGSIDQSFGKEGKITNDIPLQTVCKCALSNNAIALQPDGKIVITGFQQANDFFTRNYVVSRYNSDGTPDESFGKNGTIITAGNDYDDNSESIVVEPDGKIIIGGYSATNRDTYMMTALRYTAKGKLDHAFGNNGKATVLFKDKIERHCVALVQPNGKIILAGSVQKKGSEDFALCRLNSDGTIDASFGVDGKQVISSEQSKESFQSALLQQDGKIILTGYSLYNEILTAVIARYDGGK